MTDANPYNTPLPAGADVHLVKNTKQASPVEIKHYQSLIGSLLYVQIGTHLDISFAVSCLAQYAANPSKNHGHPVNKRPLPRAHPKQSTWPWPMWPTKLSGTVVS